jgi:cytochrome c553
MKRSTLLAAMFLSTTAQAQMADHAISDCAPCHGTDGISKSDDVPNLAGQNYTYLLNQLRAFHAGKRAHKEMRTMSRHMTEEDMEAIADYFSSLPPR